MVKIFVKVSVGKPIKSYGKKLNFFTMNIIGNILRLQMKRRRCRNSHLSRNFSRFAFKWKWKEKVNDICSLKRLSEHLFIRSGKTKTLFMTNSGYKFIMCFRYTELIFSGLTNRNNSYLMPSLP